MATRLNPTNFGYQNFYSTTLTGDITSGTLTIGLATVPTPSSGVLIIEPDSTSNREVIVYTSKGASTITCPSDGRGYSGSSASAHLTGTTVIMAPIDKWFTALASGELSTDPLRTELFFDFVVSGLVWTADAAGSTRNASMTSGVIYINGRRLTLAAVTARSFTASKDTYIDVSDTAGDGTGTITYTEVANNAASPALAANAVRIGIIVTAAGSIAAAGSVNQGQEDRVVPIASSVPYSVADSLGNLICPRDPLRRVLNFKQILANQTGIAPGSAVQITGLTMPVIIPANRKVNIRAVAWATDNASAGSTTTMTIWDGAVGSGTQVGSGLTKQNAAGSGTQQIAEIEITPSSTSKTYNIGLQGTSGNTGIYSSAGNPSFAKVELV